MESSEWEGYSSELARTLVIDASRTIANEHTSPGRKRRARELAPGSHWTKKATKGVGTARISDLAQRATRLIYTKEPARKWRAWLRRLWFALPEPAVEQPHKWWNVIAATGWGGRASEEQRKKLVEEINEILIFAP